MTSKIKRNKFVKKMYHQFRLNKIAAHQKAQKVNRITLPITTVVVLGVVALVLYSSKTSGQSLPFLMGGIAIFITFALIRGYRRGKKKLNLLIDSYIFVVKEDVLIRRIEGYPELTIPFSQIKQITKYPKGHFTISTADPRVSIHIPETVEDAASLESILQQIQPIQLKAGQPFFVSLRLLFMLLPVAALLCAMVSENKWIVGASALLVLAGLGWLFYYLFGNKVVPSKTKVQMLIFGVLLLVIILVRAITITWV